MTNLSRTIFISVFCLACVINNNKYPKPKDLSPETLVDRTRILGIQAEPPEIRPGESAAITALLADPHDEISMTLWVTCTSAEATPYGCPVDFSSIDMATATQEELTAAGIIGLQPLFEPEYRAPENALDHLDIEDRPEGDYVMVQSFAFPETIGQEGNGDFDFNAIEAGFKRLVISEANTPNQNPAISLWTIDGQQIDPDVTVSVRPGEKIDLGIELSDGAIEIYEYVNSANETETRTEEPYANWYATDGTMAEAVTLYPFLQATWTAPEEEGVGVWWAVLRDRRGGLTWFEQSFSVTP